MPADSRGKKLLYKIAKAYYKDGLTQQDIGERFGLSRIKVSRLLDQAREEKIVQVLIVHPPEALNVEYERKIEEMYHIKEAVVVSPTSNERPILYQELGEAAAACLVRHLQGHEVVGLTWGGTMKAIVDALPAESWPEMRVVQLLGGLGRPEAEMHGADLTRRMAQTFGAKPRLLYAPGIVPNKLVCDALKGDAQIADTLTLGGNADVIIVGLGRPTADSPVMQAGILTEMDRQALEQRGAVGDIALRFIDARGEPIEHEINERIIGVELESICKARRIIGVAGGSNKYEVIRAALMGKLINVLVTDEGNAMRLIQER
jgi:DNA-binding transcriptional regulator LsrR (DeoR family)